jgi:hypothetical protein
MKHIKPINEFFGPFKNIQHLLTKKKKSEDDQIALDLLKRIEKITPENNPYEIKKVDGDGVITPENREDIRNLQDQGVNILLPYNVYKISFDDVDLIICGYRHEHGFSGELYLKSHDEDNIDEIKCNKDITSKIYNIIVKVYKNDDGKSRERLARIKRGINPAADLL